MSRYQPGHNGLILDRLENAVHAGNITAMVPEDLEVNAHNTLWEESKPHELTLLKCLPTVEAKSVRHEYTRVTDYGVDKGFGFFDERGMAEEVALGTERIEEYVKLLGLVGPTFLLAHLEKTQRVLGANTAQGAQRIALRRNLLFRHNRALYFSDSSTTRSGLRFRGLAQQIREGTDGTLGTSPYGSHEIDMQGQPLTVETLRRKIGETITLFGFLTGLFMDPLVRGDFEASLDSAQRLQLPVGMAPFRFGQNVQGLQTQGGICYFATDNTLSPRLSRGPYNGTRLQQGAPANMPTVTVAAGADGSSPDDSMWDAASAGDVFYMVTEVVNDREGLGRRAPAASLLTVNVGQEVQITIQPTTTEVDSFRIYRGHEDTGTADTDAWFIFEVAADGTGSPVIAWDDNLWRPRTGVAFGLNLMTDSFTALTANGEGNAYEMAKQRSADFLTMEDNSQNTVAVATLGPKYGILALHSVLAEVDRPLMYHAGCLECRNPFQNLYFKNIGYRS